MNSAESELNYRWSTAIIFQSVLISTECLSNLNLGKKSHFLPFSAFFSKVSFLRCVSANIIEEINWSDFGILSKKINMGFKNKRFIFWYSETVFEASLNFEFLEKTINHLDEVKKVDIAEKFKETLWTLLEGNLLRSTSKKRNFSNVLYLFQTFWNRSIILNGSNFC